MRVKCHDIAVAKIRNREIVCTKEHILNLAKSNRVLIVITLVRLIWHRTESQSAQNQSRKSENYSRNSV